MTLFVIWMLVAPIVAQIVNYFSFYITVELGQQEALTLTARGWTGIYNEILYFVVGGLLLHYA